MLGCAPNNYDTNITAIYYPHSRSWGPIPDYQMHDPSCSDSVALVAAPPSEEQQIRAVLNVPSSESLPANAAAAMEAEYLEVLLRSYVVNGTKRKLDWLTDDVAINKSPDLTESTATEAGEEQSDFSNDFSGSHSDHHTPSTSQTDEFEDWIQTQLFGTGIFH
jgi:hypothetical protein